LNRAESSIQETRAANGPLKMTFGFNNFPLSATTHRDRRYSAARHTAHAAAADRRAPTKSDEHAHRISDAASDFGRRDQVVFRRDRRSRRDRLSRTRIDAVVGR
jgi:hypothetical protein